MIEIIFETEKDNIFDFDYEEVAKRVIDESLKVEKCPLKVYVCITIVDAKAIREINNSSRNIDSATDVLSFPNLDYNEPSDFNIDEEELEFCTDPETGEVILGDIVINYERVLSQAEEYNHSAKREFAFLVAHSMMHLCGYDHMTEDEATIMEGKQELILNNLGITRDK